MLKWMKMVERMKMVEKDDISVKSFSIIVPNFANLKNNSTFLQKFVFVIIVYMVHIYWF